MFTSLQSGAAGDDCNGHGTHVAATVGGLVHGVAKNVTLLAVRALECLGNGTVSQVRGRRVGDSFQSFSLCLVCESGTECVCATADTL